MNDKYKRIRDILHELHYMAKDIRKIQGVDALKLEAIASGIDVAISELITVARDIEALKEG
jgi:hypothetical protein